LTIPDWKHADDLVRHVGNLQVKINNAEDEAHAVINRVKADLQKKVEKWRNDIDLDVISLEAFAMSRRGEFKDRSRKLDYGRIGWHKSTSIKIKTKTTLKKIKELFTPAQKKACIITKETVGKEALAKLTDEDLARVDARRVVRDDFFVEPDFIEAADHNE